MSIQAGSIVWAEIADRNGRKKDRPGVVVGVSSIATDPLVVCAVTSRDDQPRPAAYVRLPWSQSGMSGTGLTNPCFAVATWIVEVDRSDIRRISGKLSPPKLKELLKKIEDFCG